MTGTKTSDSFIPAISRPFRLRADTLANLKAAGFKADELRGVGFEAHELTATGFTVSELKEGGYTAAEELRLAGCVVRPRARLLHTQAALQHRPASTSGGCVTVACIPALLPPSCLAPAPASQPLHMHSPH